MRIVEIRRRRPEDGEIQRLVRVFVQRSGDEAEYELLVPDMPGLEPIIAEGIADGRGGRLHLADGERYLDELPTFYHGSRFWAEEIEGDEVS